MRLRNIPGARETIAESQWIVQDPASCKGKWKERFGNDHPVHLEIGTGKGKFINQLAVENPDINYVGIEKYSSVLIRALDKLDESQIGNLLFIRGDAELICEYFGEGEVEKIYLNFSDPWPKDRHAKRRLPSKEYLRRFAQILTEDGMQITYDLHSDPVMNEGNIMTEYEERFSAKGNPICKYILGRKE